MHVPRRIQCAYMCCCMHVCLYLPVCSAWIQAQNAFKMYAERQGQHWWIVTGTRVVMRMCMRTS
jgi:hypothetical protein